jgi:hypothetical protein
MVLLFGAGAAALLARRHFAKRAATADVNKA